MARRELFSRNLRALCEGHGTISQICRDMQINRQQFSRYLAGSALPSEANLELICGFFGIAPEVLFESRSLSQTRDLAPASSAVRKAVSLLENKGPSSVEDGTYFVTFAYPGETYSLIRAVMVLRTEGNLTTFRRLTGLAERSGSWWAQYNGDHHGVVMERRGTLHFLAINDLGNREPSLLTVKWATSELPMLVGTAAVITPMGSTMTSVVINKTDLPLRRALRRCHMYGEGDPGIETAVLDQLHAQGETLVAMVRHLDIRVSADTRMSAKRKALAAQ